MKPLVSVRELAFRLRTQPSRLYEIAGNPDAFYREWPQRSKKNPTKIRIIREPLPELKEIQRRIVKHVLVPLGLSDCAHGGVKGRSPKSNARLHCGRRCVVTLDVQSFFDSASHHVVNHMLREDYGMGRDVAYLITRLCTLRGSLPQGAPSSTALANLLVTASVDAPLTRAAHDTQVVNTRFVDDIALSGADPRSLINVTARLLSARKLRIWRKQRNGQGKAKLKIMWGDGPQEVTGLLVNSPDGPTVSRPKRDAIRAAIFQLQTISDKQQRELQIQSIRGRIAYVRATNPGAATALQRYLATALRFGG